jgi:hypothetical protein
MFWSGLRNLRPLPDLMGTALVEIGGPEPVNLNEASAAGIY